MRKYIVIYLFAILVFVGCNKPPEKPIIKGVEEGQVYAKGVYIQVEKQEGIEYQAVIDDEPYKLGSLFDKDGQHILKLVATKASNQLTSESIVAFEVDKQPPRKPVIEGVTDGGVYFQTVKINISNILQKEDVDFEASIDGESYRIGSKYKKEGQHVLKVTAIKEKNGLQSEAEVTFEIDNKTYSQEEVDYFTEIALGSEYRGTEAIRKWMENVRIKINGSPTDKDLETLHQVIEELNGLITPIEIEIVEENENVNIYFMPSSEFKKYIYSYVEGNWGYFSYNAKSNGGIWRAKIGIESESINQKNRSHLIREELTQSLGLGKDSIKYKDSIFYQGITFTQEYAAIDKKVIELLYREDILLDMKKEEIYGVLKQRIR